MKSPFFKASFIISILISLNDEWFECFSCNNWHTNLVIKKLIEFNGARFLKYFKTCHYCAFTFMKKKAGSWFTRIHLKRSTCTPLSLLISFYYNNLSSMIFGLNRNFDISKNSMCTYSISYCLELIADCLQKTNTASVVCLTLRRR